MFFVRKDDKRSSNKRGTKDYISDGSVIHVYDNQFMMLVDGGKVVDYTSEPGYYKVDNNTAPSMFNGELGESVKATFSRIKYGGVPSQKQQVFYINLQEIKGIKFGTRNPINYFDNFYNAELFLRAHGTYSIKITDPLKFYAEAVPRSSVWLDINDINEQYLNEFLEAMQSAINQMSTEGIRISFVSSKTRELGRYMSTTLDEEWRQMRGMEIESVGIASLSYDEQSQKLINMRNQGAMLENAGVREGYVQGAMARGIEAAGSNEGGSMAAFMGVGMGMNAGGNMAGVFSKTNQEQMQQQQAQQQTSGTQQGQQQTSGTGTQGGWQCSCGAQNRDTAKFCPECGKPKGGAICSKCGYKPNGETPKFCPECGNKFD